ncbi:MAG: glycosyltransferase family 2 protein [bacterium]|nr:glycosyltransferase family 2 protein [bacterium]
MDLSIIIPCYNEEKRLLITFTKIYNFLVNKGRKTEIIFINDGSRDKTQIIIENICRKLEKDNLIEAKIVSQKINRGKGYAVKIGIAKAVGKHILICDADLSTPITELEKLLPYSEEYHLVIGSRKQKGSEIKKYQPVVRVLLGKSYSLVSKYLLRVNINDFTCGFKLIKRASAKEIAAKMTIDRWAYDSEILKIAEIHKMPIKEVGVVWWDDRGTKVRILPDILRSSTDLFKIIINSVFGKYN